MVWVYPLVAEGSMIDKAMMMYAIYPISFILLLVVNSVFVFAMIRRLKKGDDFAI